MKRLVLLVFGVAACASTQTADAGSDASVDGPLACQPDAGPTADSGISEMAPTHPPHQNACSAAEIDDYAKCQGQKQTDFCAPFKPGGASAACGACIETPFFVDGGQAIWGVIVFNGTSTASMNVEGCVTDALGTPDCGNALHHLYECEEIVCGACTGGDFGTCELQSVEDPKGFCKSYADDVASSSGPCASINGDAMPPDVTSCFPDASITDSTTQQVDWLKRIITYMCGP